MGQVLQSHPVDLNCLQPRCLGTRTRHQNAIPQSGHHFHTGSNCTNLASPGTSISDGNLWLKPVLFSSNDWGCQFCQTERSAQGNTFTIDNPTTTGCLHKGVAHWKNEAFWLYYDVWPVPNQRHRPPKNESYHGILIIIYYIIHWSEMYGKFGLFALPNNLSSDVAVKWYKLSKY